MVLGRLLLTDTHTTVASFRFSGNLPCSKELLNSLVSTGATSWGSSFNIYGWNPSGSSGLCGTDKRRASVTSSANGRPTIIGAVQAGSQKRSVLPEVKPFRNPNQLVIRFLPAYGRSDAILLSYVVPIQSFECGFGRQGQTSIMFFSLYKCFGLL